MDTPNKPQDTTAADFRMPNDAEIEYGRSAVGELNNLFESQQYKENLIKLGTTVEMAALQVAQNKPKNEAQMLLKGLIENAAAELLGKSDVAEAKKMGKDYGEALKKVEKITYEGVDYPVARMGSQEFEDMMQVTLTPKYQEEITSAQKNLEEAQARENDKFETLKNEILLKAEDASLLKAMSVWGKSPNSAGEWGSDDKGFHAGVTHYFEYRQNSEKAGRFKREKEKFGTSGFVDYSKNLHQVVVDYNPATNPQVISSAKIVDGTGQERLIALLKGDEGDKTYNLIIAFKRIGEPMRVISVIPSEQKQFAKAVENELNPKPDAKKKLNDLGPDRNLIERFEGV